MPPSRGATSRRPFPSSLDPRMIRDWKNTRVTVMGLGRFGGGVGVTRWLAAAGARVTVTDQASAARLEAALGEIADLDVTLRLGGHAERDFRDADLVVVNPAVPESSPFLHVARHSGIPVTTEINLFVERCPARIVGVTGSVGKSTVTAMIGHVLDEATKRQNHAATEPQSLGAAIERYPSATTRSPSDARPASPRFQLRRVWVGGNIGRSLLDALNEIQPDDVVVLELSSFQLQRTPTVPWSPHIAVITNITPNHLDWHGDFAAYQAAKLNIVRHQDHRRDALVLGPSPEMREFAAALRDEGRTVWCYGLEGGVPVAEDGSSEARWEGLQLRVPGRHNRENAAAALTVARVLKTPAELALAALGSFEALPHRLQRVAERAAVIYYDDSKSTTPEAAMTALRAIETSVLVILGGYDKGSDLRALAQAAARRAKFAACIGTTGPALAKAIAAAGGRVADCGKLAAAVAACRARARAGDVILLSPGCASWDQFVDYRDRGETFARLARGEAEAEE